MTHPPPTDPASEAVTPAVLAAAWAAWRIRHQGSIGPGPAFKEAITAGMAVALAPLLADIAALRTERDALAAKLAESRAEVARLKGVLFDAQALIGGCENETGPWGEDTFGRQTLLKIARALKPKGASE